MYICVATCANVQMQLQADRYAAAKKIGRLWSSSVSHTLDRRTTKHELDGGGGNSERIVVGGGLHRREGEGRVRRWIGVSASAYSSSQPGGQSVLPSELSGGVETQMHVA